MMDEIKLKLTWRMAFYVCYLIVVVFFVTNALLGYYEHKMFAGMIYFLYIMSYLFSIFLIRKREVV